MRARNNACAQESVHSRMRARKKACVNEGVRSGKRALKKACTQETLHFYFKKVLQIVARYVHIHVRSYKTFLRIFSTLCKACIFEVYSLTTSDGTKSCVLCGLGRKSMCGPTI